MKTSYKVRKLERNRYSIYTDNLDICIICGRPKQHLHEVYFGNNRQNSMKYGCVIPLCMNCHNRIHKDHELDLYWKKKGQVAFEHTYPDLNFLSIFYKNYL